MPATARKPEGDPVSPSLWDPLVRLSHWGIALAVLVNGLLSAPGGTLHVWIGWTAMCVLGIRALWGLIGPREARFSAFPPDPRAGIGHLVSLLRRETPKAYPSHNPAGALMVYALWASLTLVSVTGLVMTSGRTPMQVAAENAAVAAGDWSALVSADATGESDSQKAVKRAAEAVHETAANLMLLLALLHVAGVVVEGRALRRNLVRPMLFGDRE
ncbi:cytochrome b/b6 domain-containing protein [Arenibacterium sp. LLYu02]|uniref:cytochrome b/b6 domain-containing protein n=1 Tax=Arenibacterium sp. LLYu02 TaxID=3404132 RepID=UPI003B21D878